MIRNEEKFREWENHWISQETLNLDKKFRILDGMYREARALGLFPPENPMEGLEEKIRFVRALNVRRAA